MANEEVGLSGRLYAKASGVTNEAANLVADFRGAVAAPIQETIAEWIGQNLTRQDATITMIDVPITIGEIAFKPALINTLLGATSNGSDNLKSALAEAATSYTISSSTAVPILEYLMQCTLGGKTFQIYCKGYIRGMPLNFTKDDYIVFDAELIPVEASSIFVKFLYEN